MTDRMLQAALRWAEGGWAVFPVKVEWSDKARKHIKRPLVRGGFRSASKDRAQLIQWWAQFPGAAIGGVPASAGYIVIDPDVGHDPALLADLPPTRVHRTISGGAHWLYQCDEDFGNEPWADKIDVRSAAGFVVLPPSEGYAALVSCAPAVFPEAAREKLRRAQYHASAKPEHETDVDEIRLRNVLSRIDPNRFPNYDAWAGVLAAIAGSGGTGEMALEWSSGRLGGWPEPENYCGDYEDMDGKLATFTRTEGKIAGFGTLWHHAYSFIQEPPPEPREDTKDTAEWWMARDLEGLRPLIGPISRGSRVQLHAPTGAGKTHVAMAISAGLASGQGWLHWRPETPGVVLYIDGEMPLALMQERIREAVERLPAGTDMRERWVLKSAADHFIPPLNSLGGQQWVDGQLDRVKPDLVVFDNVAALTIGDMKETESWRGLQAWTQTITKRGIAQLWVHHANKDGTAYGDKTREYQMDTVVSLLPVGDDADGVKVKLTFPKKREHHPGRNDAVYVSGIAELDGAGWRFKTDNEARKEAVDQALFAAANTGNASLTKSALAKLLVGAPAFGNLKHDSIEKDLERHRNGRYSRFARADGTWCWGQAEDQNS